MLNKVKKFTKSNVILSIGFLLYLSIVGSYEYIKFKSEWFPCADFIFNLVTQISLAYIGSSVFYIIQVYIPEKKKRDRINMCISTPVYRIIFNIETPIIHFKDKVIGKDRTMASITEGDYKKICVNISLLDIAPMIFTDGTTTYYKDYIYENIKKVKDYSKQILNYVSIVDSELISIINDIFNSKYH